MIVTAVLRAFASAAGWVLGLFPTTALDLSGAQSMVNASVVWQWMAWANHYVPLDLAAVLLAARIGLWAAVHAFEAASWALTKVHILGGSS